MYLVRVGLGKMGLVRLGLRKTALENIYTKFGCKYTEAEVHMVMIWYQVVLCVPATLVLLLITLHSRGKKYVCI